MPKRSVQDCLPQAHFICQLIEIHYLLFDIVAPNEVCIALGCIHDAQGPSFSIRVECPYNNESSLRFRGHRYSICVTLVYDRVRRAAAAKFVTDMVEGGKFLRLYHILDLLRMMSKGLDGHYGVNKMRNLHPSRFPALCFAILKSLYLPATCGPKRDHATSEDPVYLEVFEAVTNTFLSRWRSGAVSKKHEAGTSSLLSRPVVSGMCVCIFR